MSTNDQPPTEPLPGTSSYDGGAVSSASESCCAGEAAPTPPQGAASRAGLLSSAGAVISAVLASACCWLPLLLVVFGASAAGVAGFFEQYRLAFLGGAGLLLAIGFYFAYFREETCGPDGVCAAPSKRLQRLNRVVLWVATALVVAAGAFPRYVGAFLTTSPVPAATPRGHQVTYVVSGMTCESCAVTIRSALQALPGVARADVSFERKTATIVTAEGSSLPSDDTVIAAVRRAGYGAARASEGGLTQ